MAEDLTTITWRSVEWIQSRPEGLNSNNVLDYFAESPFWDNQCNNAILKMQTQYNDLKDLNVDLKKMKGIEFQVVHEKAPVLWVIRKQNRLTEWTVSPIATYYILNNNIYQAPDLYSIIGTRILTSLYYLHIAFNTAQQEVEFHPATGYTWKGANDPNSALQKSKVQQDPIELIDFRDGAERAISSVTHKMQQQLAQAIAQTEEDNLLAINELNDSLMTGTPGEMSDSPSQPMATDQMGKRRKKSEDATGKKKKKKQTG
ncbi:hypothetical protein RclHR1_01910010 [Rhizophagus clarus]|uniref:Mediator of RNA polymerase II transcription subunit 6 n=1 Tax=Rhizophagus clarus TaxID=94130 RepID=A0A2Z6RGX7_9GLOM|nr:hypothetical protein RclHR1_01910010 [Rhizophagus clarus]GES82785.1 mediator complex subunit Pmc5 [Rhizophagus clarus]